MKISFLMLTLDRFEKTSYSITKNLQNCGMNPGEYELLVADNGSSDQLIVDMIATIPCLSYHRKNSKNEGVAKAFNQLALRAKGEVIVLLGNDIVLPDGWADSMYRYCKNNPPKMGLVGIQCTVKVNPPSSRGGVFAHWVDETIPGSMGIFGVTAFSRSFLDDVGLFHDGFDVYGLEDSDLNYRALAAGYDCCYIPGLKSEHIGGDVGENTPYRKMKDESLEKNLAIIHERALHYKTNYREPLPEMRDPL